MGGIVSYLFLNKNENNVNGDIDFTFKQKKLMRQTWNNYIRPNLIRVGVNTMLRLFDVHPDIKDIFLDFKDIPCDKLINNKKFHAHCQMIMTTVNNAVDAFLSNDVELFNTILIMSGERHAKRAMGKINSQHFQYVKDPLIESIREEMKSNWNDKVSNIWIRAVKIIIDGIIRGINNYNNEI